MTQTKFFQKAESLQAFLKVGFLGFPKSGKTFTATLFACGLHEAIKSTKPIVFIDTETGSDFVLRHFKKAGIDLLVAKKRAFVDLLPMCEEAVKISDILIIDSITAFWTEIMESYLKKTKKKKITFPDWNILKPTWRKFTDFYLNSPIHIFMLGRAGWEYNFFQDEDGSMELQKVKTRMKAETDIGYEPSLLIEMIREMDGEKAKTDRDLMGRTWTHNAYVIGDRSDILDGKSFRDPTFEDFEPVLKGINIGGTHFGVDTQKDSQAMFEETGKPDWKIQEEKKVIALDEIQGLLTKYFPSTSGAEKKAKLLVIEHVFNCRGWKKVESKNREEVEYGLKQMESILDNPDNVQLLLSGESDLSKLQWAIKEEKKEEKVA